MLTDIQIAQQNEPKRITEIAEGLGFKESDLDQYGLYKAKIPQRTLDQIQDREDGKLILVTAINPTAAGEGKTTITVGLGDALQKIGKKSMVALREPSFGPTFGLKGGAAGGGYAQVVPMEDINMHFTGDMHAITTANNLLSAVIDNHIHQGNKLNIDNRRITWKRVVDMNDRNLRHVVVGLGGPGNGYPREDGFDITVASEVMAALCLATDLSDLRDRFNRIVIGETRDKEPVTVEQLGCAGAMTLIMKDAIEPNLVQTLEHTPALVHGGPFANIAHGCNSIIATKAALKLADYAVTEAGFGADLGGEKFMDIVTPNLGKTPDAVVIVTTIRSMKMHGGIPKKELKDAGEDVEAVKAGVVNLEKHIETMQGYNVPVVVALNEFVTDTEAEIAAVQEACDQLNVPFVKASVWENGGEGGVDLAKEVVELIDQAGNPEFKPLYDAENTSIKEKLDAIVTKVYGGRGVVYESKAEKQIADFEKNGWGHLPICMAKTQYSLTDDPSKVARPSDFDIHIREFVPKIGAGFIVALTGDVMTMPGLPKEPAAMKMDIKEDGTIEGLF
ncbi:formate--tetrahydrofolate ligase [Aerococcus sanguinicola]|uniref:formate--tetrahydrofolate ligase n=1 Tax=unclassified Aerococcus TaxID=2618060 RepID=UPI0008A547EE|nr:MULTISPECIES: formate--tetrahydrofolate ligase [unclassified Aerococcus]MDK6233580.1 formate--tetrahydrofolate ligase [Aerococcus sp. UMB10185]MDK6804210.1 formate--tetrahydrofolate ligase [Aerococcus sp. UMB7834]MDK6856137.1 formate--tetrahydrofolate ligase [Aerococcus sp. UMB7533]MDK8501490.1 formate--tetrahydrofolate ligase [Aerococcus sp. UMB1112A]OFN01382.1 formate--tetrahydrofolate ligase [Aerococcus sp. HMSC062A02]